MILILKDEASMRDFRKQHKILPSQRDSWSATSELNAALHSLLSVAVFGLVVFLKEASASMHNLVRLRRMCRPSFRSITNERG